MIVFIDTSAFYATLDRDDANHPKARSAWADLLESENTLVTTNYVIVESFALIQNRLGLAAVRDFQSDILPLVGIEWVNETIHRAGVSALFSGATKRLSMVDCTSFETMRSVGIRAAFVFDSHFSKHGFTCIP